MTSLTWIRIGSGLMFLAVGLGAFGAHAPKNILSADRITVFETGIRKFGAITPLGGLLFLAGWALLALSPLTGSEG